MQNAVKPGVLPTRLPVLRGGLRCRAREAYLRPLPKKVVPSLAVRPWLCYLQLDDMAFSSLALKNRFSAKLPLLKWSSWYLIALKIAMGLLLVLLIALFVILYESDAEERRATLIADVLWLEQSVNFHLEGHSELLQQLAADLAPEKDARELFKARSQYLLNNNPDIHQIIWFDAAGKIWEKAPTLMMARLGGETADGDTQNQAFEMARRIGKLAYSDAYSTPAGAQFEMYMPVFDEGAYRGSIAVIYSFSGLLKTLVPWWFAEKYQIRIMDSNGIELASKSKVTNADTTISYSIPLEPPGYGMVLRVDAYRGSSSFVEIMLTTLVIGLASAVLLSLWVMRGHIRGRIAAEQAHRAEYAFRKAMEDSLTVGMRARDSTGRITYVNPAFCEMVGFSEEELLGATAPMPFWAPEEMEQILAINEAAIKGKAPREGVEVRLMRKDGSRFDALVYEAPLIDADGNHAGWMASLVDVTARKRAEGLARQQQEKLQVTSRLVTMGEMASSLAHELNQPLAAITSYTAGCMNKLESGVFTNSELKEALGKLGVQAQRAGRIIRRVHDFVRKSEPKLASCNLVEIIDDSLGLIESSAKLANIRVTREIELFPGEFMGDRVMLEQVLLNLLRNAVEAMSGNAIPQERRSLIVRLAQFEEQQVQIHVADRGPGIPLEIQENLFTPFFTTKASGMGMGLNICRSIIEFHRGRLWFEENPEGGTVFIISLPVIKP